MKAGLQAEEAAHDIRHRPLSDSRPALHNLPQRAVGARQDCAQALPVLRREGHLQGHTMRMSPSSLRRACRRAASRRALSCACKAVCRAVHTLA